MTYNKLSIKELKEILEEYNCAIPSGAKKKDLVELVEAVMAKDEDFVTMQITNEEGESSDLMSVEGMDMTLALELSQKGINDREELAEQSIEELISLIQISEEDAGELIMKARAHWFE